MTIYKKQKLGFGSLCVKDPVIESLNAHVPPVYATSTFAYPSVEWAQEYFYGRKKEYVYSRLDNPTNDVVAHKIALLEAFGLEENGKPMEVKGVMFSSGMAAISAAVLACIQQGGKVLTQGNLYGTTNELFQSMLHKLGIQTVITDLGDLDKVSRTMREDGPFEILYIETPANPTLSCYDIQELSGLAHEAGARVIVDNTFASPYFQQPLRLGADLVAHSSTKFLNGHGTGISGCVVGRDEDLMNRAVMDQKKMFGGMASPFESFLLNNGLKTLNIRMEKHASNASIVADFLKSHPKVEVVHYLGLPEHPSHDLAKKQMTGFGGMLTFEIRGGLDNARRFLNALSFCTLSASLGTADTLIQHPASMSHVKVPAEQRRRFGITDGMVRMSVGLESAEDIVADLTQALEKA